MTVFDERGSQIDITDCFHQAAESLREPYLKYLYAIGRDLASLRWWITGVSYRSSYASRAFHHACHLKVALDLAGGWDGPGRLVLVVPDRQAQAALKKNLDQSKKTDAGLVDSRRPRPFRPALAMVKMLASRVYFIWRETGRLVQTRYLMPRPPTLDGPTTVIVSYATQGNLRESAKFHESYFGDLTGQLNRAGHSVAMVPMVLKDVPYGCALRKLRESSTPLMMPHRYLTLGDILGAAFSSCIRAQQPRPIPQFCGLDIGPLIEEELRSYRVTNWAADVLLVVALVRRWAKSGIPITRVIYIYENQPWERALCWAFSRYLPHAELVGYQHARTPRFLLNFYLAPEGEPLAPLPDRVVTVGQHTARLLVQGGYHTDKVRVGGALQMQGLLALRSNGLTPPNRVGRPTVLIACSIGQDETAELIDMAVGLFDEDERVQVVVKCHPLMPFQQVSGLLATELPGHVQVTGEDIPELLVKSSLMVYSSSTVCIQALALGLPVIHLRARFDLDTDPLEAVPGLRLEAAGLEGLRQKVRWLIAHREDYIAQHQADWDRLVDEMYGPVNEETVHAFVD